MLVRWIEECNPFDRNVDQLRNIETGMAAEKDVNVDRCQEIIYNATPISFKKKNKAVTMHNKAMKIDDETVLVDPNYYFRELQL